MAEEVPTVYLDFNNWSDPNTKLGDGVYMSPAATEFMRYLASGECTLEALGWPNSEPIDLPPPDPLWPYNVSGRRTPSDVLELETASAAGDLTAVKAILQRWREEPKEKRCHLSRFASSFRFAMQAGDISIASYMLECGILMNEFHFKIAMDQKLYPFMDLFLSHGFDINSPRGTFDPGLLAKTYDDEKMTRWFLDHNADPNAETVTGVTPLSKALLDASMSIIEMLFDYAGPRPFDHGQLLNHAVHREKPDVLQVLEYLFTKGAREVVNRVDDQDRLELFDQYFFSGGCGTPLHEAAKLGKQDVVKFLVAHGSDPLIQDQKGLLAVDCARKAGQGEVVDFLTPLSSQNSPL